MIGTTRRPHEGKWRTDMSQTRHIALVADDDEFFRVAIEAILLDRLDIAEVIETGSLDEATERLGERDDITLALFDLAMPGMDSPANLAAVRETFPDMIIVMVSSSKRRSDVLGALEAGVHGYIPKGLGVDELTAALRTILAGSIYVPPLLAEVAGQESEGAGAPATEAETAAEPAPDLLARLTPRQRDVLELVVEGKANKEIARILDLGQGTVKIHLAALFRNLGVRNRSAAAVAGARLLSQAPSGKRDQ